MFKVGDMIVHQRHGAGTVIEPRTIEHDGQTREYFCIELSGDRGLLMVPRENVNEDEIRPALTTGCARIRYAPKSKPVTRVNWRRRCAICAGANTPTN